MRQIEKWNKRFGSELHHPNRYLVGFFSNFFSLKLSGWMYYCAQGAEIIELYLRVHRYIFHYLITI